MIPTQDQYTTYDYEKGAARLNAVENEKYKIQLLNVGRRRPRAKLKVTLIKRGRSQVSRINALSKQKTLQLAKPHLKKWRANAQKVLSATETAALYWNIIYHYKHFERFLVEQDNQLQHKLLLRELGKPLKNIGFQ